MAGVHNIWVRVAIIVVSCVIGLIFPLALIVAAFLAYTIFDEIRTERSGVKPEPVPESPLFYDQDKDGTWEERSEERTESVAEQAFVRAMIKAFGLSPAGNDLAGGGIVFGFQREILRYRVDFILNDWLIVEIDGAEWHSSAEAVERDGIRDAALRELDYSIIRIPAKTVFQTPKLAVKLVREALEKPTTPITVTQRDRRARAARPKVAAGAKVLNAVKSVSGAIDTFDNFVDEAYRKSKVAAAVSAADITFTTERAIIENAIASTNKHFEREKEFEANPEMRELYEKAYAELDVLMKSVPDAKPKPVNIAYVAPAATGDVEMDASVRSRYDALLVERGRFLDSITSSLKDGEVRRMVISSVMKTSLNTAFELASRSGENIYQNLHDEMTLKNR